MLRNLFKNCVYFFFQRYKNWPVLLNAKLYNFIMILFICTRKCIPQTSTRITTSFIVWTNKLNEWKDVFLSLFLIGYVLILGNLLQVHYDSMTVYWYKHVYYIHTVKEMYVFTSIYFHNNNREIMNYESYCDQ